MDTNRIHPMRKTAFILVLLIYSIVLIRTAWISDDAFITLRTAINHINGFGARFNIDERVQGYTHAAWYFAIYTLSLLTKNVFVSTYILSYACSIFSVALLIRNIGKSSTPAVVAALLLVLSKAFIDFSTSGLENPLAHLLIALTVIAGLKLIATQNSRYFLLASLSFSSLYLVRPDLLLLLAPYWIYLFQNTPERLTRKLKAAAVSLLPPAIWTVLSIIYYGEPFPNTAYAKLGAGISAMDRWNMGLNYFIESFRRDPITLTCIVFSLVVSNLGEKQHRYYALGIMCYLIYIASIGGDFMSGRFFTAPLFLAVISLASMSGRPILNAFFAIAVGLGFFKINYTLLSGSTYKNWSIWKGIADERGIWFPQNGLIVSKSIQPKSGLQFSRWPESTDVQISIPSPPSWTVVNFNVIEECGGIGLVGLAAGPSTHIIDQCALVDPLLARLKIQPSLTQRIGHFRREIPDGYKESIAGDQNLLTDSTLKMLYDDIRLITRGSLLSTDRAFAIWRLNTQGFPRQHEEMRSE